MPLPPTDVIFDQAADVRTQLLTLQGILGTPSPGTCQPSSQVNAQTRPGYAARADTHLRTFFSIAAGENLGSPSAWITRRQELTPTQQQTVATLFSTYAELLCQTGSLREGLEWHQYAHQLLDTPFTPPSTGGSSPPVAVTLTFQAPPDLGADSTLFWDGLRVQLEPPRSVRLPADHSGWTRRANDWLLEPRQRWPWLDASTPKLSARTITLHLSPGSYGLEIQAPNDAPAFTGTLATQARPAFHTARSAWLCERSRLQTWSCQPSIKLP